MENKDYKIVVFEKGDFKDDNGNFWCNIGLDGEMNEPVRIVVKDPMDTAFTAGLSIYGHIEVKTSKAGKPYRRFYREKKPDVSPASNQAPVTQSKYTSNDDVQESIARSVALKAAVDLCASNAVRSEVTVLETADKFLAWLTKAPQPQKSNVVQYSDDDDNAVAQYQEEASRDYSNEEMPEDFLR